MTKRKQQDDNLKPLADEYGAIKAQLAELESRKAEIKQFLEAAGVHELEGDTFRIVGSQVPESTGPDWEKIARRFAPQRAIDHKANHKVTRKASYRVSVYGRTGEGDV